MTANLTFELPIDLGNWDLDFIKTVNYGIKNCQIVPAGIFMFILCKWDQNE